MLVYADKDKLRELAKSFYNVSRTLLAIYDANKTCLCAYPDKMSAFCTHVRQSEELTRRCHECDRAALEHCERTHTPYVYKCHMGLVEVAVPIIQNHLLIGYLLFGQFTDSKDRTPLLDGLAEVADAFSLDYDTLEQGVGTLVYRSPAYISSISQIVEMCAAYIWQNSFMSVRQDTAAHAVDLYIRQNLHESLSVSALCAQFHLCRSALYSLSKEHFGCGISDYVMHCRLEEATRLLGNGLPVYEVAERVGIPDANYFIRVFKKQYGTTPKQYGKRMAK